MTISWPTNTGTITDQIRNAIGRDITVNYKVPSGYWTACPEPTCTLNPKTGLSTDQFCQTCNGEYWLNTTSGISIKSHVTWKEGDIPMWYPGGRVFEGDCLVQMKYTIANVGYVASSTSFIVDGRELEKKSVIYRGVPDVNRILVTLEQQDND